MVEDDRMEVDIWKGDWGLPSIDVQCLEVMVFTAFTLSFEGESQSVQFRYLLQSYARFSGAPIKYCATSNPFRTPNGSLPVFQHGNSECLTKFEDISSYLRKNVRLCP